MRRSLDSCLSDDKGATAIEYAIIAAMIATLIIAATALIGTDLQAIFDGLAAAL